MPRRTYQPRQGLTKREKVLGALIALGATAEGSAVTTPAVYTHAGILPNTAFDSLIALNCKGLVEIVGEGGKGRPPRTYWATTDGQRAYRAALLRVGAAEGI